MVTKCCMVSGKPCDLKVRLTSHCPYKCFPTPIWKCELISIWCFCLVNLLCLLVQWMPLVKVNTLWNGQMQTNKRIKFKLIHISKWVLENTCMNKGVSPNLKSQGLPLTIRHLVTMTRQPSFRPIIDIMVNQNMTGVLFNLMAKMILKISFVHQKYWGLWNSMRVFQHPI